MAKTKNGAKPTGGDKTEAKANSLAKDERLKILLGLFTLSFSVYMLFAFISYLFTWKVDESQLDIPFFTFFKDAEITVENWSGKLGAMMAYQFLHKWFGIASFSFVFIFGLLGIRLLNYRLLPFRRSLKYSIIFTIWISIALGFVFHKAAFLPGGAHGYFMSAWFNALIGKIGTGFLLFITLFGILAYTFEGFVGKVKNFIKTIFEAKVADSSMKETEDGTGEDEENKEWKSTKWVHSDLRDGNGEIHSGYILDDNKTDGEPKEIDPFTVEYTTKNLGNEEVENPDENSQNVLDNIDTIEATHVEDELNVDYVGEEPVKDVELSIENRFREEDEPAEFVDGKPMGDYDPTLDLSRYVLPPIELLVEHNAGNVSVSEEELVSNKNRIVETLANYKIQIDKIKAIVGPTITLYEIVPAPGIRISKIKNLEDDIALSLAALGIRIIAPIPGRGTVGIEVPNLKPEVVSMRSIISSKKFQESKFDLPIALGKTISNETFVVDLTKMPHLLVAGATGQGKSVGLNAILTSLLFKKHPSQLKLVLVDPKKVELTLYQKLEKYFLAMLPNTEEAIITDTMKVVNTLNSLCVEMDSRYDLLKAAQVRNIKEYNAKFIARQLNPNNGHHFLPYIVVVIDEFADLIMTAGKEVELPIARLAQLARAIGIHLVIATQRPTTNIITGLIKANFPARIAFRVTSMMDSRTILDSPGANQLIGRGDMLISQGSDMVRLQCAFIDTPEIESIMNYIQTQQSYPTPYYLPEYYGEEGVSELNDVDLSKKDPLFDDAARIIVANQQGSTSLIQRKFSIGYNRAGRIIDQLEAAGIVGAFEGSKARQVLILDETHLEQILKSLS
ncbi:MAG TPA: cell division protein FtsK [Marinilabiliales bacterium]|jgi:S-DNA-T family DNA segregation ATPase FtsK/SpoIIIE|nr:MAG: cell division protein FtsK [Bacteroidetes bacterium GWA2_40_14]OFX58711.1 MAG: cell division protein FtsK [Bacteroidetes bacterium GWC2_40_13]OFX71848.1 MAG: cell division protein FtsK [Bacteroidetes bacterium GWD2_40_43]OFX94646.1 MAG: cell division protein FtsK [Bacteroidetes bacterium GWE2_40_63]HAM98412.1 cell division protein FtsK [Marinilabiliales bacterium]